MNRNKQIQFHFMKNIEYNIFIADKPGRMNADFSNFTLQHRLFVKSSAHNVQHTNTKSWQYIVELLEEDSLMTRNKSEVANLRLHAFVSCGHPPHPELW